MKALWITPKPELVLRNGKIASNIAGVRYRALIPAHILGASGHEASVRGLDKDALDELRLRIAASDVIVFRRHYEDPASMEALLEETAALGKKTVFDLSDDRLNGRVGPHLRRMIAHAGAVVTTSPALRQKVKDACGKEAFVIGDPFEGVRGEPRFAPGARLKALWFGHPVNFDSLKQALPALLEACKKQPIDLRIVTGLIGGIEHDCKQFNATYRGRLSLRYAPWSPEETWRSLSDADFVLIPYLQDHARFLAKSPNRMIESLWAGRFVVAQPIPSYMEFGEWAWIGDDLVQGIDWMRENGSALPARIKAAQEYIAGAYSPEHIAAQWLTALEQA